MSFSVSLDIDDMGNLSFCKAGHSEFLEAEGSSHSMQTCEFDSGQRFKGVAAELLHRGITNGGDSDEHR
ncbi:hypothetical protein NIBR502772_21635 [Pseudarthrobacter sp. NIBRBAC000502772]|uniref:hypothetical protein n=1 Tax=Pseudarthrobacter sp. NIBRBAC000502772 TaxID=2590775 RepID=UPI0011322561|nr:hypothetical protein [Pseudarthrobacter sp. NIBRBAC000502772]QDG68463.1 hypothetical protein NIBR502772_21635 [Pseudarthrobacter sp. NIBRBAC000502772]